MAVYIRAALDSEGDIWGQADSGEWRCLTESAGRYRDLEELSEAYGPLLVTPDGTEGLGYPAPGSEIPPELNGGRVGFVVGLCHHAVAGSEWRAGMRNCERCPS